MLRATNNWNHNAECIGLKLLGNNFWTLLQFAQKQLVLFSIADPSQWHYMTLQPSNCPSCSQYITCQSCTATGLCEWWSEEAKCERRGRYQAAIVATQECYEPCHERVTCSQCLQTSRCVWCAATQVPSIVLQGVPKVPCQSQNFRVFYLDILHKKKYIVWDIFYSSL